MAKRYTAALRGLRDCGRTNRVAAITWKGEPGRQGAQQDKNGEAGAGEMHGGFPCFREDDAYYEQLLAFSYSRSMPRTSTRIEVRKQPRQARSAAMVEAILEAAARILETEGLAAFNTNAIAEKAGVSIGSLYQYFPTKEAMLTALVRRSRAELMAEIQREKNGAEGSDLRTVLDGFIRAALIHQLDRPRLACALEYAEIMLPIGEETNVLRGSIDTAIAEVLSRYAIPDPEISARDLAALTRGMLDAAGLSGETDMVSLERRVKRAAYGYLGI